MRIAPLLKSAVKAPVQAMVSAIFGLVLSAVLLLMNIAVHEMSGLDEGQVSQLVQSIARYLPVVFGLGSFAAAFLTDAPLSAVFGTARWASPGELKKLGTSGDGLLIGRDDMTGKMWKPPS